MKRVNIGFRMNKKPTQSININMAEWNRKLSINESAKKKWLNMELFAISDHSYNFTYYYL